MQPCQDRLQGPRVPQARPLGAVAQALERFGAGLIVRGLKEQLRMTDETLAQDGAGLLVARKPRPQGARRQRVRAQGLQEAFGVIGIGARQGDEYARGRP